MDAAVATPAASPWLTTDEAAARAKCSRKVILAAVRRQHLKAVKVGNAFRFHVEWLDAWLEARATRVVNPDAPGPAIPFPR